MYTTHHIGDTTLHFGDTMACMNCRLRKLKVTVDVFQGFHPFSHYPSVDSSQLIRSLVSDVSKKEFSVNIVPWTQVQTRTYGLRKL